MNKPGLGGTFRTLDSFSGTCMWVLLRHTGTISQNKARATLWPRAWVAEHLTPVPTPALCGAVSCCLKRSP